jgi:hypothetical protein
MNAVEVPALRDFPYLGGVYDPNKKQRETLSLASNETPAYVPEKVALLARERKQEETVQQLFARIFPPPLNLQDEIDLIVRLKDDVRNNVYLRFQLLHLQFLTVYKTHLQFRAGGAVAQACSKKGAATSISLAEAHVATLPSLLVLKEESWRVLGEGSFFHNVQNTTLRFPKALNNVDSWIDETGKPFENVSLRDAAISLINTTSSGARDPRAALAVFIDELYRRVLWYGNTAVGSQEKVVAQFYAEAAVVCKRALIQGDDEERALCFQFRTTEAVDDAFFLRVQKEIHLRLRDEMPIQQQRQTCSLSLSISDTQNTYAKIYINSTLLKDLLRRYFTEAASETLISDWTCLAGMTLSKIDKLSSTLQQIITTAHQLILTTYGGTKVQSIGSILRLMLFDASLAFSPTTTALYQLPAARNRRSSRLQGESSALTTALTKTQQTYAKLFLENPPIQTSLREYHQQTPPEIKAQDLKNIENMTGKKMSKKSAQLQAIVTTCLALQKAKGIGIIVKYMLEQTRPSS